jgi:hypothetical protein
MNELLRITRERHGISGSNYKSDKKRPSLTPSIKIMPEIRLRNLRWKRMYFELFQERDRILMPRRPEKGIETKFYTAK